MDNDEYKFQLRDAGETAGSIAHVYAMVINYLSRDVWQPANIFLTFQRFFVYLYVLGRTWLCVLCRASLSLFSLSLFLFMSLHSDRYTIATIHPEFMVLLERKFTSIHDLVGESRANQRKGRKINNRASRDQDLEIREEDQFDLEECNGYIIIFEFLDSLIFRLNSRSSISRVRDAEFDFGNVIETQFVNIICRNMDQIT